VTSVKYTEVNWSIDGIPGTDERLDYKFLLGICITTAIFMSKSVLIGFTC